MASQPDSTILWCLEQLATENLKAETLVDLIKYVTETRGLEVLEEPLKVRLMLAGFSLTTEITGETLEDLQKISTLLNQTQDEILFEKKEELMPPPELMTQVKTVLVAQGWRNSVKVNSRELLTLIRSTFGQQPEAHERKRFDELQKAVTLPGFRAHIDRQLDGDNALNGIVRYALEAQAAMGPTLLQVVNDDINSGNYIPGQPLAEPEPAGPSPSRVPIPSPSRLAAAIPQRNVSLPTSQILNPMLQQAMAQLQRAGGEDPLQQAAAQAQILLAAAAFTGANDNSNNNAGRILVSPARPTFPQNNARPVPEALRRASLEEAPASAPPRRRNKRWTEEEVDRLIEACRKHGPGAWAQIEADNRDIWGPVPGTNGREYYRTQVDLKDKWRNLAGHKGDKAHRNHPEALAVEEMWIQKWVDAEFGTTTAVGKNKANIRRTAGRQKTVHVEEQEEEEEDVVIEDAAAQTTEVQDQRESGGEVEANDGDEETARPAKKAKKKGGSGRKKSKKSEANNQRMETRSKK